MDQASPFSLQGKTVLVTGAGGDGVGAGVCEAVHHAQGRLILVGLDFPQIHAAAARFPGSLAIQADISQESEVIRLFQTVRQEVGFFDGLVNNAGIGLSKPSHEIEPHEFQHLIDVDLKGLWMMSKAFVQQCIDFKNRGSVVNISSVHAHATIEKYALYASVKAGVQGLTRGMAIDHGPRGIRFNAVAPGYVDSEQNTALLKTFTPDPTRWVDQMIHRNQTLSQKITPIDCGNPTVFFLSEAARACTGQTVYVDAGTTLLLFDRNPGEFV